MTEKQYIDVRVIGNMSELTQFIILCKSIQTCGVFGSSKTLKLIVDGSGSLLFKLHTDSNETNNLVDFGIPDINNPSVKEFLDVDEIEMYIGE